MTEQTILPLTSPDDMRAVLQFRTTQLLAALAQGAHPQVVKDHIVSMYQVADILLEAWTKRQAANDVEDGTEPNAEERAH